MMTEDNRYFLDTNILLAATDELRQGHDKINDVLLRAQRGEIQLYLSGQVFREYLVVATRPRENNGFGLSPEEGVSNLNFFRALVELCPETEEVSANLRYLVENYNLKGKRIHDANITATMMAYNIEKILTLNIKDFTPFSEIHAQDRID
jgi:predicted nucleic acid-binding protein